MFLEMKEEECCGCSACMNICPTKAIQMKAKELDGFLYPIINKEKCVKCGLCERVCPLKIEDKKSNEFKNIKTFVALNNNEKIRRTSSSGGIFVPLSDILLREEGVIYGAKYDSNLNVVHGRADNKNERDEFKGSKYVQSNVNNMLENVKRDLKSGKKVMFSGTPCQVSGLNKYLKLCSVDTKNLVTVDLVCHGAPSPKIYKENIKYLESKFSSKINKINFRGKVIKNQIQDLKIDLDNGRTVSIMPKNDLYYSLFLHDIILRPSCYKCRFANLNRQSDITLADCWNVENVYPELQDFKGISMVLINSNKGEEIFNKISDNIEFKETSINKCMQRNLYEPCNKPKLSYVFWKYIQKKDYRESIMFTKIIVTIPRIKHAFINRISSLFKK